MVNLFFGGPVSLLFYGYNTLINNPQNKHHNAVCVYINTNLRITDIFLPSCV